MLDGLLGALALLFEWPNPVWILAGILFGMLIGFLPGMAGSVALALLIPLSFTMEPEVAVLFLIGAYAPAGFGGMLTSILVNTPGDPENAATTLDGYPMAKQGRAGAAIGAATTASVLGGLFGTAVLIMLIPVAEWSVLSFSYPEYFMLAIVGLCVIAVTMEGTAFKGIVAAGVGFMIAFMGLDPVTGGPRFTFDQTYFWDGVNIIPVLIGLFAGSEILALYGRGVSVSESATAVPSGLASKTKGGVLPVSFWEGATATFRHWFLIIRSSLIGTICGIIPGVGGSVSGFLAYSHAKQSSKHPEEFGRGSIEGVISSEAANDAKAGGSMVPTVAFGIPGTVGMAVLLGALIMHGLPIGPALLVEHIEIIYVLIVGMTAAKFVAPFIVWMIANQSARLTRVRPGVFTPVIAIAALVGTYTVRINHVDVFMALLFCYIGYGMRRYGYSRIALIIAFVLGELVERTFHQTSRTFGSLGVVLERPIAAVLLVVAVLVLGYAAVRGWRSMRHPQPQSADDEEQLAERDKLQPGRLLFAVLLMTFVAVLVAEAWQISTAAADFPLLIGVPLLAALALLVLSALRPLLQRERAARDTTAPRSGETRVDGGGTRPEEPAPGDGTAVATAVAPPPLLSEQQILRRQMVFGAWALGFALLAWQVSYLVAMPVALGFFLAVVAKERLKLVAIVTVATSAAFWLMFDLALGVPLS